VGAIGACVRAALFSGRGPACASGPADGRPVAAQADGGFERRESGAGLQAEPLLPGVLRVNRIQRQTAVRQFGTDPFQEADRRRGDGSDLQDERGAPR